MKGQNKSPIRNFGSSPRSRRERERALKAKREKCQALARKVARRS